MSELIPMGKITIGYYLDESGEPMTMVALDDMADELPIVVQLGLIEMARDTILHPDEANS